MRVASLVGRPGPRWRLCASLVAVTLLGPGVASGTSSQPAAMPERCFGKRATITGTPGDDEIKGTPRADVIVGGDGLDYIDGKGGNDRICGNDQPIRYDEEGFVIGENLIGGWGTDRVNGGRGFDLIDDGSWRYERVDEEGHDILLGGPGSDSFDVGAGDDRIYGGGGNDRHRGEFWERPGGDDVVFGGPGHDTLDESGGRDRLYGGGGNDELIGRQGRDLLKGSEGSDVLAGGNLADRLRGGAGRDVVNFTTEYGPDGREGAHRRDVTVDLRAGTATGFGHDDLANIESAWGGAGSDLLIGDGARNVFYPGSGSGDDRMDGRGGRDKITFDSSSIEGSCCDRVVLDLAEGVGRWGGAKLALSNIEDVTASIDNDKLLGDGAGNLLIGGWGDDVVSGRGGRDDLYGGEDADQLRGGRGPDRLLGGLGRDRLYGGPGRDANDGGPGVDRCTSPDPLHGARNCELYAAGLASS